MPSDQFHRVEKLTGECEQWREIGSKDNPSFENSWANASGYETAAFYKDPFSRVYLKGSVASGATSSTVFTLPTGYRPGGLLSFVGSGDLSGGGGSGRHGDQSLEITIASDGSVDIIFGGGGTAVYVSLDDISWRV